MRKSLSSDSASRRLFLKRLLLSSALLYVHPRPIFASDKGKQKFGVNLAGAEFSAIGGHWHWPSLDNMKYYLSKGISTFRIPFLWERIQPVLMQPLQEESLKGLDKLIAEANKSNATVILDMHNFGRRGGKNNIIGETDSGVSAADFAFFWGEMAKRYGQSEDVWYGLMNEPYNQDPIINLEIQNEACKSIRKNGGVGVALFSGIAWTGAHSWLKSGNSNIMLGAKDPLENYCFDMHQYLDRGFGGSNAIAIHGVGAIILSDAHQWAKENKTKIFLGEFSTGPSPDSLKELDDLIKYMYQRNTVFIGGTYWAGGGVWGDKNTQTTDPKKSSPYTIKPQLEVMLKYIQS